MKKSYSKTNWINGKTPVNSTNLGKIETAISDLYSDAIGKDEILEGDGISIEETESGLTFNLSGNVQRSETCLGIEYSLGEPDHTEEKKLYFVLNPTTKKLEKIILNGVVIFEI
jgi:hypothetical protein